MSLSSRSIIKGYPLGYVISGTWISGIIGSNGSLLISSYVLKGSWISFGIMNGYYFCIGIVLSGLNYLFKGFYAV